MTLRYARARVDRWLHPTLAVPTYAPVIVADSPLAPCPLILGELRGYRKNGVLVILTPRGTELPVPESSDWLVMDVVRYVAQVERAPELDPWSRRV